jgi:hypothetical protein
MRPSWCYVRSDCGQYLLQVTDRSRWPRWGFALFSDDRAWEGGFAVAKSWWAVRPEDVPPDIKAELDLVLEAILEGYAEAVPLKPGRPLGGSPNES